MPKQKKGGGRHKKNKMKMGETTRELLFAERSQVYGKIESILGDSRFTVNCLNDGKTKLCKVRGKLRKRAWMTIGDIVLVSLREFQEKKADIIYLYNKKEVRDLKIYGEIPNNVTVGKIEERNKKEEIVNDIFEFDAI